MAVDGMWFWSTRNSMYQPGGAIAGAAGAFTVRLPGARAAIGRSTRRCELSNAWVVTPLRMSSAHSMFFACGDAMSVAWQ